MQELHDKVLDKFLQYKEKDPNFTFYTRRSNRSQRLENGYWFLGNENYINIPLFNVGDSDNNTQTIGFVYEPNNKKSFIEIVYKNVHGITENEYNFYKELVNFLPYKEQKANQNRYWYVFKNNDVFQNLNYYIGEFRNKCIDLIRKYHLENKYLIIESQFNKYLERINNYKNQKAVTKNDILMVMEKFRKDGIEKEHSDVKHYFKYNNDVTIYPRKYIVTTTRNNLGLDNTNFTNEQAKSTLNELFQNEITHIDIEPIGNNIKEKHLPPSSTLSNSINKIFYGPPGTGKTFELQELQKKYEDRFVTITFHQSYGYEDFVEGLKADIKDGNVYYHVEKGIFRDICKRAEKDLSNNYAIFIDEINRGNISKIFGELITLIEISKRGMNVKLPYSKKDFSVPRNLSIIGTMNTADRSIAVLDTALRRRFEFEEIMPIHNHKDISIDINGIDVQKLLKTINKRIEFLYDRDHMIGHAYFIDCDNFEELQNIFKNKIIPLLQEYFYDDWEKINLVFNNNGFIIPKNIPNDLFSNCDNDDIDYDKKTYELNSEALEKQDEYIKIYAKINNTNQGE